MGQDVAPVRKRESAIICKRTKLGIDNAGLVERFVKCRGSATDANQIVAVRLKCVDAAGDEIDVAISVSRNDGGANDSLRGVVAARGDAASLAGRRDVPGDRAVLDDRQSIRIANTATTLNSRVARDRGIGDRGALQAAGRGPRKNAAAEVSRIAADRGVGKRQVARSINSAAERQGRWRRIVADLAAANFGFAIVVVETGTAQRVISDDQCSSSGEMPVVKINATAEVGRIVVDHTV